ncbi:MAG: NHL repeat-containing protein [Chitinispirillaceae bacterium]|jgi:outer membrane protein assembly factor BamB|nr:NHL repeat-containing protein [Chitinispirillaceae bacterium]
MRNTALLLVFVCAAFLHSESLVFPPFGHSYGIRKATGAQLFMFFGPRTFFDDPQGIAVARLSSWEDPLTERDDDEVTVYGVNSGRHQIIFNTSMWSLGIYGSKGSGIDQFLFPKGIAADGHGNVFVADSGNNRVVCLHNQKSKLIWRKTFSGASGSDRGVLGPSRVAVDERVNVYVTDPGHNRIMIFDSVGVIKKSIPAQGSGYTFENGLTALAVADSRAQWSFNTNELAVFCADQNGTRLWKIAADGTVLVRADMPRGHAACYGAVDYYHNYWVTDNKNHCVVKYDRNLVLLDVFGSRGTGDNQFVEPRGIAIYKRFGQAFIAEKSGAQYYWIGTKMSDASIVKNGEGSYTAAITAAEHSFATLYSAQGKDTVTYFRRFRIPAGPAVINFNAPKFRQAGLVLRLEATYSSRTYSFWDYPITLTTDK